jgi:hypothetical protein
MCHREDPEQSEGDRSDLKQGEIAALLSVARNDDVTGFGAFVVDPPQALLPS